MLNIARKIFGTQNDRSVKQLAKTIAAVNAQEESLEKKSDIDLRRFFDDLRKKSEEGESLDGLLPYAFAATREAAKRTLKQRPFDVQLMGGIVLHQGKIAEMATGEGKTLTSTMPACLNALTGKGVHVVTVNDYLAERDANWMAQIYDFLGLRTGVILESMQDQEKKAAYNADITYGTNNQFGFDYLRDNLKPDTRFMVQREFNYAIIDEVDSILIDEARTPLIISGPADDSGHYYTAVDKIIDKLVPEDYEKDEKVRTISLTEEGQEKIEEMLFQENLLDEGNLYDIQNVALVHHVNQALRAHHLFQKDRDYLIKENKVIIIDEFTGRMMDGRRYSDGLHQALEAKEAVTIQKENQTLASITFQNYFRLYPKLSGMTGTAMTEVSEFEEIYKLSAVEIPTNRPIVRKDHEDEIYRTYGEKLTAITDLIATCRVKQQPVLVGTTSIEKSEELSKYLTKKKVTHNVLNARHHEKEADVVAEAGKPGAVTIATNMAGRGTDIKLGGNPDELPADEYKKNYEEVLAAGGLYIIATERHESRRIDNQLRGRAGRQGDAGESKFFLSLEDDLMRIFGSDRLDSILQRIGMPEGEAIKHPWISKALEKAQKKVEQMHFEGRKNILKYDDVMNDQRKVIYEQRKEVMQADDISDLITEMRHDSIERLVESCIPPGSYPEQWNIDSLHEQTRRSLGLDLPVRDWAKEEGIADEEILERLTKASDEHIAKKVASVGADVFRFYEKRTFLEMLDSAWKEHLLNLDHLRQGIGLRSFGQRDPLNEFKTEAFDMFHGMLDVIQDNVTQSMSILDFSEHAIEEMVPYERPTPEGIVMTHASPAAISALEAEMQTKPGGQPQPPTGPVADTGASPLTSRQAAITMDPNDPSTWGRVPRNAACPCGSGKKYKHCHGSAASQPPSEVA